MKIILFYCPKYQRNIIHKKRDAKSENGSLHQFRETFDMNSLIQSCIRDYAVRLSSKNV